MNGTRGFTPSDRAGFTLLELLMVVIIIAILSAIALPQYLRITERSRAAQMLPILSAIRTSEIRYKSQIPAGVYTTTLTDLDIDLPAAWPAGWGAPTVTGTDVGSNVETVRGGGGTAVDTKALALDLDNGVVCGEDPAAGTAWGVAAGPC